MNLTVRNKNAVCLTLACKKADKVCATKYVLHVGVHV